MQRQRRVRLCLGSNSHFQMLDCAAACSTSNLSSAAALFPGHRTWADRLSLDLLLHLALLACGGRFTSQKVGRRACMDSSSSSGRGSRGSAGWANQHWGCLESQAGWAPPAGAYGAGQA